MPETLVDRLRGVRDRLSTLNERLGDPRYPQVVMMPPSGSAIVVTPNPKVSEVNPRMVAAYLASGVEIAVDDKVLEGISRSYDKTTVSKSTYILEAVQRTDGTWTGQKAEVISVSESDILTWTVVVRRYRSR